MPLLVQKGKAFMEKWGQFQHSWAEVDQNTPIKPGAGVGVAAGLEVGGFGAWSLMPLEVLYKEEKPHGDQKKGKAFRYGSGCLEGHWFEGEERFR